MPGLLGQNPHLDPGGYRTGKLPAVLPHIDQRKRNTEPNEDGFSPMFMPGGTVREKKAAGDVILGLYKSMTSPEPISIGQYRRFDMKII